MRIGGVSDDLLAAVGKSDVIGSGDDLTVALLLAAVIVVSFLYFVSKAVRIFGRLVNWFKRVKLLIQINEIVLMNFDVDCLRNWYHAARCRS